MLSERFYRGISLLLPLMNKLGVFRLTWDPQTQLFRSPSNSSGCSSLNKAFRKRQRFNEFLIFTWLIFAIVQLIRFYKLKEFNNFYFIVSFLSTGSLSMGTWLMCTRFLDNCCSTFNGIILYLRGINREQFKSYLHMHSNIN